MSIVGVHHASAVFLIGCEFHPAMLLQPDAREGQAGRLGVVERFVVPGKPGNASGGKGSYVNLYPNVTRKLHRKMYRQKRLKYTYSK